MPVKVRIDLETLDLDMRRHRRRHHAAHADRDRQLAEQSDRARLRRRRSGGWPTVLEEASARNGRRIFLLSDEPYNRIVFSGVRFRTPAEFYPHTLMAYSYGKTLLAPGQRIGYLALPPALPDRPALRRGGARPADRRRLGLPQRRHAVRPAGAGAAGVRRRPPGAAARPDGRRADRDGVPVHPPEGTFYLFPRSPIPATTRHSRACWRSRDPGDAGHALRDAGVSSASA